MDEIKKIFWMKYKKANPETKVNMLFEIPLINHKLNMKTKKIDGLKLVDLFKILEEKEYYENMLY